MSVEASAQDPMNSGSESKPENIAESAPEQISEEQRLDADDATSSEESVDLEELEKTSKANDDEFSDGAKAQVLDNDARLEQLEKEHETLRSQYMRIAADFDNFRKRQSRDQDDLKLQLTCSTLSEILPVVDNFERARQQLEPEGDEAKALHRSYQGLYKQLVEVLKQLGVAPMRVVDQPFDPNLHEAVLREPSDEKPEDIVLEELQRGYHLNGRVLRHALVKVSMGPGPTNQDIKGAEGAETDGQDEQLSQKEE